MLGVFICFYNILKYIGILYYTDTSQFLQLIHHIFISMNTGDCFLDHLLPMSKIEMNILNNDIIFINT